MRLLRRIFKPRWEIIRNDEVISTWFWYSSARDEANALDWIAYFKENNGLSYHKYFVRRIDSAKR